MRGGVPTGEKTDLPRCFPVGEQPPLPEQCVQAAGDGGRGVDDGDFRADKRFDRRTKERVVGAAEHQGVGPLRQNRRKIALKQAGCLRRMESMSLDLFH